MSRVYETKTRNKTNKTRISNNKINSYSHDKDDDGFYYSDTAISRIHNEIQVLQHLEKHDNVCRCYEIIHQPTEDSIVFCMEYMNIGSCMLWDDRLKQYMIPKSLYHDERICNRTKKRNNYSNNDNNNNGSSCSSSSSSSISKNQKKKKSIFQTDDQNDNDDGNSSDDDDDAYHYTYTWPAIALLFTHLCRGMQHMHSAGIVHRDIKPDNLLLCRIPVVAPSPIFKPTAIPLRGAHTASSSNSNNKGEEGEIEVSVVRLENLGLRLKIGDLGCAKLLHGSGSSSSGNGVVDDLLTEILYKKSDKFMRIPIPTPIPEVPLVEDVSLSLREGGGVPIPTPIPEVPLVEDVSLSVREEGGVPGMNDNESESESKDSSPPLLPPLSSNSSSNSSSSSSNRIVRINPRGLVSGSVGTTSFWPPEVLSPYEFQYSYNDMGLDIDGDDDDNNETYNINNNNNNIYDEYDYNDVIPPGSYAGAPVDCWAAGCTLHALIFNLPPFYGCTTTEDLFDAIMGGLSNSDEGRMSITNSSSIDRELPVCAVRLLHSLMTVIPLERFTMEDALQETIKWRVAAQEQTSLESVIEIEVGGEREVEEEQVEVEVVMPPPPPFLSNT